VAELAHGADLDLADPLRGEAQHTADLEQGPGVTAVGQAEPQGEDHPFPVGQLLAGGADQHREVGQLGQ